MKTKFFPDHMTEGEKVADLMHVSDVVDKAHKMAILLEFTDEQLIEVTAKIANEKLGYDYRERFGLYPNEGGNNE